MSTQHKTSTFVQHQLDAKLRVAVPSDWRPAEGEVLRLMATELHGKPVVRAYFSKAYERKLHEIENLPRFEGQPAQRDAARRYFKSHCHRVEINSQGKLTIPKSLADHAGLPQPGKVCLEYTEDEFIEILNEENHDAMLAKQAAELSQFKDLFSIG